MLYFLESFRSVFGPLRLFEYVTFRSGCALLTSLLLVLLFGPVIIRRLSRCVAHWRYGDMAISTEGADLKKKTPTMGGLIVIPAIFISTLLWSRVDQRMVVIFLIVLVTLSLLGFADDYLKIKYAANIRDGVSGRVKLLVQFGISVLAAYFLYKTPNAVTMQVYVPFFKEPVMAQPDVDAETVSLLLPFFSGPVLTLPLCFTSLFVGIMLLFNGLVVTGTSNAVNLTDGKDGLVSGCLIFCALTYAAMAYMCGHALFARYLNIPYIANAGEVAVFACSIAGACIGFLWYNCNPASIFLGDTGSLPLGGVIGLIAVLIGQQILLLIVGFVFVMEALSDIIQVGSYKLRKKRVFLCAPIHHHFEKKGWSENQIVIRFWIIAGICALIGLATLKLR